MRLVALGFFASLALAIPASAQSVSQDGAKEAKAEKPKRICKSIKETGRRIPRRECKTQAEWSGDTVQDAAAAVHVRSVGSGPG